MRQGDCAFQISGQLPGTEHCITFLGGLCCWGNSQFTASEGTPSSLAPVFCSATSFPAHSPVFLYTSPSDQLPAC